MAEWQFVLRQFRRRSHTGSAGVSPAPRRGLRPCSGLWPRLRTGRPRSQDGHVRHTRCIESVCPANKGCPRGRSIFGLRRQAKRDAALDWISKETSSRAFVRERSQGAVAAWDPRLSPGRRTPKRARIALRKRPISRCHLDSRCNADPPRGGMRSLTMACHRNRSGDAGAMPRRLKQCVPDLSELASNPVPSGSSPSWRRESTDRRDDEGIPLREWDVP